MTGNRCKARLQLSLAENVFCQGMVVRLNPVCILLSEMLHVYKSEVHVAVFETYVMTSKTLASIDRAIENRKIVCIKMGGEESISYNYRFHIVTRFKS